MHLPLPLLGLLMGTALLHHVYGADPALKKVLEEVALNYEVMACVSNSALISPDGSYGMLKLWIDSVKRAGVTNYLVIAIDEQVAATMKKLGVPHWYKEPKKTADAANSNHGISARKFQLIQEFLELGYHILLSDVDIVTLKDPFKKLFRDSDIEAMSDGFDPMTAYGWDDVFDDPQMGWSRWAHSFHIFTLNSGLFYTRANERTIKLMQRITDRLNKEKAWDQAVFNEMVFKPSSTTYTSAKVSARIMDIYEFVNSKTLFRTMRNERQYENHIPTMVHVNYHPDKFQRMQSIWARYVEGNRHALDKYHIGSE